MIRCGASRSMVWGTAGTLLALSASLSAIRATAASATRTKVSPAVRVSRLVTTVWLAQATSTQTAVDADAERKAQAAKAEAERKAKLEQAEADRKARTEEREAERKAKAAEMDAEAKERTAE